MDKLILQHNNIISSHLLFVGIEFSKKCFLEDE